MSSCKMYQNVFVRLHLTNKINFIYGNFISTPYMNSDTLERVKDNLSITDVLIVIKHFTKKYIKVNTKVYFYFLLFDFVQSVL